MKKEFNGVLSLLSRKKETINAKIVSLTFQNENHLKLKKTMSTTSVIYNEALIQKIAKTVAGVFANSGTYHQGWIQKNTKGFDNLFSEIETLLTTNKLSTSERHSETTQLSLKALYMHSINASTAHMEYSATQYTKVKEIDKEKQEKQLTLLSKRLEAIEKLEEAIKDCESIIYSGED